MEELSESDSSWLAWFDRKISFYFPLGYLVSYPSANSSHVINIISGHYASFFDFEWEPFRTRGGRLEAQDGRLTE